MGGAAGNDVFVFNSGDSTDTARDVIAAGISDFSGLTVNGYVTHTVITDTNSDFALQLQGAVYNLTESDFVLAA